MAFVYKSENDHNTIYNFQNDLGPGEYLDKNVKQDPKQQQEPFLSSTQRKFIELNEVPGPGTYYKDVQKIQNFRNLKKSEHNQNIDWVRAQVKKDIICLRQTEKLGFDIKAKRFQNNDNKENKTPGPGHYFPSILNNENKNKKIKLKTDNGRLTFSKLKNSFSLDKTGFSTFVIEGGNNVNKCRKTFQYDNFGCRPKIFDIRKYREFMELTDKSNSFISTNYSDSKNRNTKFMNSFYYNNKDEYSINQSKNTKDKSTNSKIKKIYRNNSENKNTFNYRINLCKKLNKRKINNKNDFEKLIANKTPGPGYYFDDIHDISIQPAKPKSDYYQFFGSKVNKFYSLKKPWTDLGPGQYFISNQNKENKNDEDIPYANVPFGSHGEKKSSFLCIDNIKMNPGPGEYEIQSFTNNAEKEIISDVNQQFLISGERFNDKYVMKDKYRNPGPGYYEPKIETISLINERKNKKNDNIFINLCKPKYKRKTKKLKNLEDNQFVNGINSSIEEYKYKEKIPPVGYYYPDFFDTIEYKNKKKMMDTKHDGVSFSRTITKGLKKSSSTSELLGPGYYNPNRDNKKNIYFQVYPPFNSSCERSITPIKKEKYKLTMDEYKKYYMNEFFNWNKRSHNVNFI